MKVLVIQQDMALVIWSFLHMRALSKELDCPITLLAKKSSNAEALFANDKHMVKPIELEKSKDGLSGFFKLSKELAKILISFFFNGSLNIFFYSLRNQINLSISLFTTKI